MYHDSSVSAGKSARKSLKSSPFVRRPSSSRTSTVFHQAGPSDYVDPISIETDTSESEKAPSPKRSKVTGKSKMSKPHPKKSVGISRMPSRVTLSHFKHFAGLSFEGFALPTLNEACDQFFRQLVVDLSTFARHAKRSRIQAEDVILLLRRQRHIDDQHSLESLVEKYLPREYREEVVAIARAKDMTPP